MWLAKCPKVMTILCWGSNSTFLLVRPSFRGLVASCLLGRSLLEMLLGGGQTSTSFPHRKAIPLPLLAKPLQLSIYVYIYIHIYIILYICICIVYMYIWLYMYICIYVSMYLCMYVCIYVSMYLCIYVCTYQSINLSIYLTTGRSPVMLIKIMLNIWLTSQSQFRHRPRPAIKYAMDNFPFSSMVFQLDHHLARGFSIAMVWLPEG